MIRALLGGLLVWQGFDHWYLAIIGVALWLHALTGADVATRLRRTLMFGVSLFGPLLAWFDVLGRDAWLLMVMLAALPLLLVATIDRRSGPITLAAAVVVVEWLRSNVPWGGFPWGLLAYSQVDGPLAWAARLGGQELVSALVVLVAAAWAGRGRFATGRLGVTAAASVLSGLGFLLPVAADGSGVAVAAVQGGVPRPALPEAQQAAAVLRNHITLTTAEQVGSAGLVVWPEDAVAGDPLNDPAVVAQVRAAVAAVNRPVLVGGLVVDAGYAGPTNSSLLWLPARGPVQRYDKVHLVPFGEYLPLRTWLEQHIGRFEQIPTDMRAGKRTGVFDGAGPRFGVLICFEVAYDDHVRQLVKGDAHYLVVQSNNSTYLGTDQPRQQFAITRLRALAHARGTVVATTTGVSAVIDQRGQVLATAPEVTAAVVTGRVPVVTGRSLADRLGDWVTPLALVVVTARLLRRQVA